MRGTIFLCWLFHLPQTTCALRRKLLPWARRASESQPSSSDAKTQLSDFSQISAYASGAWRHSHLLVSFPIWGFILTSVNDAFSPRACEHLLSCLHLTNPCAKRKVLSLTKPKGKIYKTKSLGHYITLRSLFLLELFYDKASLNLTVPKYVQYKSVSSQSF